MTQDLLETTPENESADAAASPETAADAGPPEPLPKNSPENLPEKFWDSERNELRADELVKSYLSLEQKLGALGGRGVPDDPSDYEIKAEDPLFASDPVVNARLHDAGFSQDQAQTVYDLAAEYVLPLVSEVAEEFHAQTQIDRLAEKFGGEDKWRETAAQIRSWGRARFPDEVYRALAGTYDGVIALHRMMNDGQTEPALIEGAGGGGDSLSEVGLKRMMQDPRYWRDHDPSIVERVQDGFKRLFPD